MREVPSCLRGHLDERARKSSSGLGVFQALQRLVGACASVNLVVWMGLISSIHAQSNFTFVKHYYTMGTNHIIGGLGGKLLPDGSFVLTGQYKGWGSIGGGCDVFATRISPCGDVLWYRLYGTSLSEGGKEVALVSGNRLAIVGLRDLRPLVVLVDLNTGNFLWARQLNFGSSCNACPFSWADDDPANQRIMVAGRVHAGTNPPLHEGILAAVDYSGNLLWAKTYGWDTTEGFSTVHVLANQRGYILCGRTRSVGAGGYDVWILRTDVNGNVLWSRVLGGPNHEGFYWDTDCALSQDQSTIVLGTYTQSATLWNSSTTGPWDALVIALDTAGNLLWARTYGTGPAVREHIEGLVPHPGGGFVLVGTIYYTNQMPPMETYNDVRALPRESFLARISAQGDLKFVRSFSVSASAFSPNVNNRERVTAVGALSTGYLISCYGGPSSYYIDAFIVRADTAGNIATCAVDTPQWQVRDVTSIIHVDTTLPNVQDITNQAAWSTINFQMPSPFVQDSFVCIACTIDTPQLVLQPGAVLCAGDTLRAFVQNAQSACYKIFLNDSLVLHDTLQAVLPPGMHTLDVVVQCGLTTDTFSWWVQVITNAVDLPQDTQVCGQDTLWITPNFLLGSPDTFWWSLITAQGALTCDTCVSTGFFFPSGQGDSIGCLTITAVYQNCPAKDTVCVNRWFPVFSLASDTVCPGDTAWISAPIPATHYQWSSSSGAGTLLCDTCASVGLVLSDTPVALTLTIWVNSPSCMWTDTALFMPAALPELIVLPGDTVVLVDQPVTLLTVPDDLSMYCWTIDGAPQGCFPTLTFVPHQPGEYHIEVQGLTREGCWLYSDAYIRSTIPQCAEQSFWVPNAFTPNQDGKNDVLYVYGAVPAVVEELRIYTRWGEEVFAMEDVSFVPAEGIFRSAVGWDGTVKGQPLRSDVYVYYLQVRCGRRTYFYKGDVTLFR